MNYGYAELNGQNLDLQGESEEDRYFIQLYHYVTTAVDIKNKKVLEARLVFGVRNANKQWNHF